MTAAAQVAEAMLKGHSGLMSESQGMRPIKPDNQLPVQVVELGAW